MKYATLLGVRYWFVCKLLLKHAIATNCIAGSVIFYGRMLHCEACLGVLRYRMRLHR